MKYLFAMLLLLCLARDLKAQEGDNWYDDYTRIYNFTCTPYGYPLVATPGITTYNMPLAGISTTCMSDTNGRLLFFSNNRTIFAANGKPMPHGYNIMANTDSNNAISHQVFALPDPANINQYYIFFTERDDTVINGSVSQRHSLNYVKLDMRLNNGLGDVTGVYRYFDSPFDIKFGNSFSLGIAVARHHNKKDFWLTAFKEGVPGVNRLSTDTLISYLITASGPIRYAVNILVDTIGSDLTPVFSYNGRHIALYYFEGNNEYQIVKLFDYDDSTGLISNPTEINKAPTDIEGICFSPDSRMLYIVSEVTLKNYTNVYQYLLDGVQDIASTGTIVYSLSAYSGYYPRQAADGKIYGIEGPRVEFWRIDFPNKRGTQCHITKNPIKNVDLSSEGCTPDFITRHPEFMPYTISSFCSGAAVQFTPFQNLASPSFYWYFGDPASGTGDTSTQRFASHIFSSPGTYKVRLVCWNYDSIIDTFTRFVCISAGLRPESMDTALCPGETAVLDAGNPGAQYLWDTGDTTETIKAGPGNYFVTVTNGTCSIADTAVIALITPGTLNIGNDTTILKGTSITLRSGYPSTHWSTGVQADSIIVSSSGTYWATLTGDKCSTADTIKISVVPALVKPDLDTMLCNSNRVVLNALNHGANFLWNTGDTTGSITVSPGVYWVRISNGIQTDTDTAHVKSWPYNGFSLGPDITLCQGNTATLKGPAGKNLNYLWNNGSIDSFISVSQSGIYTLKISEGSCSLTDSVFVSFVQLPSSLFPPDTVFCTGSPIYFNIKNFSGSILWNDGSSDSEYIISHPGTYTVTLKNICGTKTYTSIVADSNCDCYLFVPNAFTPNQDHINDLFYAQSACQPLTYTLQIYNRWGERVFQSNDINTGWDGTFKNLACPEGVYVYKIIYKFPHSTDQIKSGTVTVGK